MYGRLIFITHTVADGHSNLVKSMMYCRFLIGVEAVANSSP